MSKYRRIARTMARRSFAPAGALAGEGGAELHTLVQELADDEDAEWLLEEDRSELRMAKLVQAIEWVLESYVTRDMTPPLERTEAITFFRFAVRDDPAEPEEVRQLRARLRLHNEMLAVLHALDPNNFELLCGRVLREVGCETAYVTRSSQDLGADFFGRLPTAAVEAARPVGVSARRRLLGAVYLMLFGQAKRYAEYKVIDLDTVKLVEGTWGDIVRRKANGDLPEHLDAGLATIGWRAGDKVTFMFVTTSRFTDPARRWAVNASMATLDGDQLAQLLLESEVGVTRDEDADAWTTSPELVTAACVT
jgi:restriction endonuclease Mrr